MSNSSVASIGPAGGPAVSIGTLVAGFFVAWLALVVVLGSGGMFVAARGTPPLGLLIGLVAPLGVFLFGYRAVPSVRAFILAADLRVIASLQAWRWAGSVFLTLYTYKVLPGIFAWPAGLGDMAVGATAPLVLASLLRRPGYATSRRFVLWNLAGILDLMVAVTIGAVGPIVAPQLFAAVSTDAMARMPLVLVPGFLVPAFLMLHLTALFQVRRSA